MIKIETLDLIDNINHIIIPTVFPDGTSQVWKLPETILTSNNVKITWNFENEAELIHLGSLRKLIKNSAFKHLHIPFLPYSRQDKEISNYNTFNLEILADILNTFHFSLITSIDVHNPIHTADLITNFSNMESTNIIQNVIKEVKPDLLVFPDDGASKRYNISGPALIGQKYRDQMSGNLSEKYEFMYKNLDRLVEQNDLRSETKLLIIDDICDGGRTFINLVTILKRYQSNLEFNLYVTHGIFSQGKQVLFDSGIKNIYTTNSILKNTEGFKV